MNRVCLLGRLTAKPELRYTNSNKPYARFTVAVNRQFNNQDGNREADFINVIVWRKQAEVICNYFDKGNQIAIEGRLQTGSYDAQDGTKRTITEIVADEVELLTSKASAGDGSNERVENKKEVTELEPIDDDNLPF